MMGSPTNKFDDLRSEYDVKVQLPNNLLETSFTHMSQINGQGGVKLTLAESLHTMKQLKDLQHSQMRPKESPAETKENYAISDYQGTPKTEDVDNDETINTAKGEQ